MRGPAAFVLALALVAAGCRKEVAAGGYATETRNAIRLVAAPPGFPFAAAAAEDFALNLPHYRAPVVEKTSPAGAVALFCGGLGGRFPDALVLDRSLTPPEDSACRQHGVTAIAAFRFGNAPDPGRSPLILFVKRGQLGFMAGLDQFVARLPVLAAPGGPLAVKGLIPLGQADRQLAERAARILTPIDPTTVP